MADMQREEGACSVQYVALEGSQHTDLACKAGSVQGMVDVKCVMTYIYWVVTI